MALELLYEQSVHKEEVLEVELVVQMGTDKLAGLIDNMVSFLKVEEHIQVAHYNLVGSNPYVVGVEFVLSECCSS